jgi:hypothetical protein
MVCRSDQPVNNEDRHKRSAPFGTFGPSDYSKFESWKSSVVVARGGCEHEPL